MPRSRTTRAAPSTRSSFSSIRKVGAEHRGEVAERRHLPLDLALDRLARRLHPEQVEAGAEPLRRAPGPPHEALRGGLRADQRQQALADRLRRLGGDPLLAGAERLLDGQPLRLDLLGDLAQGDLAQREQVLDRKKLSSAASTFSPG